MAKMSYERKFHRALARKYGRRAVQFVQAAISSSRKGYHPAVSASHLEWAEMDARCAWRNALAAEAAFTKGGAR
jgi:hypothetical protein